VIKLTVLSNFPALAIKLAVLGKISGFWPSSVLAQKFGNFVGICLSKLL